MRTYDFVFDDLDKPFLPPEGDSTVPVDPPQRGDKLAVVIGIVAAVVTILLFAAWARGPVSWMPGMALQLAMVIGLVLAGMAFWRMRKAFALAIVGVFVGGTVVIIVKFFMGEFVPMAFLAILISTAIGVLGSIALIRRL